MRELVSINSRAKTADKWGHLLDDINNFVSSQVDNNGRGEMSVMLLNYYAPYMDEKHIPRSLDNVLRLSKQASNDSKLAYNLSKAFFKQYPTARASCDTIYEVDAAFKQLVASKMR